MYSQSKFRKKTPKFEGGGQLLDIFGKGANMFGDSSQQPQNSQAMADMAQYNPDMIKNKQQADQLGGQVENAVGMMGPWGAAIAGASKLAGKFFGPDEYGDYKDGAGGTAKRFLNKSFNMKEGIADLQNTIKDPSWKNIKSQLTLGLAGKNSREEAAEKFKRDMEIRKNSALMAQSANQGAIVANSLPKFSAPAYGEKGLKFPPKNLFPPVTHASDNTRVAKPIRKPEQAPAMNEGLANDLLRVRQKLVPNEYQPWMQSDRQWLGGDTGLAPGHHLYINDAGNLQKKPYYDQLKRKSKFYRP
jgi:hypothetical protein